MRDDHQKIKLARGYVHIYTGNGKGKTTAALGLALRAAGRGFRTYIAQFMKGQTYGELTSVQRVPEITIEQFGKDTFLHVDKATEADKQMAQNGLQAARRAMLSGNYEIIVLDEINVAIYFKLIPVSSVVEFVQSKPEEIELILTGRYAPEPLIEVADLVTEMVDVKHYYDRGVSARDGIER